MMEVYIPPFLRLSMGASVFTASDHTFSICAYGESPYLSDCIESLLSQNVKSKIILVTSTPNGLIQHLASRYNLPLFINSGESGIAQDWNYAVSCAETPLITIAHQDDTYEPYFTEKMLAAVNSVKVPLIHFSNYGELRQGVRVFSNRLLTVKRLLLWPLKLKSLSGIRFVRRRCISLGSPICCPSVTFALPNLDVPIFKKGFKSDLDWQAWESISRKEGAFLYSPEILMFHRIHADSETSALIMDNTRTAEDLEMLRLFWPEWLARLINHFYSLSQKSNN